MKTTLVHFAIVRKSDRKVLSRGACRPAELEAQNTDPDLCEIEEIEPSDVTSGEVLLKRSKERIATRADKSTMDDLIEQRDRRTAAMAAAQATDFDAINVMLAHMIDPTSKTLARLKDIQRARS